MTDCKVASGLAPSSRWSIFAVLFVTRTTIAFQFQSVASAGSLITDTLLVGFATLGALIGCYMLPGVALALPGGMLVQRFGAKRIIIFGLTLMTIGGLVLTSASTSQVFAGRLISGAGAAVLNVVLAQAVSEWFTDGELVAVMGAFVASWPLGVALALVSIPTMTVFFGWSGLVAANVVPSLICLIFFCAAYRDKSSGPVGQSLGFRLRLSSRDTLLAIATGSIWGLYNVTYVVFVSALPDFFAQRGYPATEAAAIASVFGWVLIVSLPAGGYLAQRLGRANLVMISCFVLIAVSSAALALTSATVISLAVLVTVIGFPAGLILALPARVFAPETRASGMGIFFTVFYVAMATLPGLSGLVRQQTGEVSSSLLFGAATISAACLVVVGLAWLTNGSKPVVAAEIR